jgi:glutaredoxin 3
VADGSAMSEPGILLYTTDWCPYCDRAKALLNRKGLSFREIDVERDPKIREEMMARSGRRSVPQIFVGDTYVGGFDELIALDRAGKLEPLVKGASS